LVGQNVTFRIVCSVSSCRRGGALFFVRAYGRAVIPGRVTDHRNGSYDISFFPMDAGRYFVEVVLAFSNPSSFDSFPVAQRWQRAAYEGYLLPEFPVDVDVFPINGVERSNERESNSKRRPICALNDLLKSTHTHATENGRWIITDKTRSSSTGNAFSSINQTVSLAGYQQGINSLGIRMEYEYRNCNFVSTKKLTTLLQRYLQNPSQRIHIIFIGDSNMRMQRDLFDEIVGPAIPDLLKIQTTLISTFGGLRKTLQNVSSALHDIQSHDKLYSQYSTEYYILFNSGLHDISNLCAVSQSQAGLALHTTCAQDYQQSLSNLLQIVDAFPAKLQVFQSTTAGWPKYGNYGFGWPPEMLQLLPLDPTFVAHFNHVAKHVLETHNNCCASSKSTILTMDAYWLTLARPDHREVDSKNFAGKHLVHCGPEVLSVLTRQWMMMILWKYCEDNHQCRFLK